MATVDLPLQWLQRWEQLHGNKDDDRAFTRPCHFFTNTTTRGLRLQWRFARGSIMGDEQQQMPEKCNGDLYWVASTYVISPIWNIYGSPDVIDPGMRNPRWLIQLNWGTVPITLYWTMHTQPKIYTRVTNIDYTILKWFAITCIHQSQSWTFDLHVFMVKVSLLRPHAGWPKVSTKHEVCQETQSPRVEETKKRATGTHGTLTPCCRLSICHI